MAALSFCFSFRREFGVARPEVRPCLLPNLPTCRRTERSSLSSWWAPPSAGQTVCPVCPPGTAAFSWRPQEIPQLPADSSDQTWSLQWSSLGARRENCLPGTSWTHGLHWRDWGHAGHEDCIVTERNCLHLRVLSPDPHHDGAQGQLGLRGHGSL